MTEKKFKKVCKCEKCGNEAEMTITCSLEPEKGKSASATQAKIAGEKGKVLGHAVCSHCGGEADMWLEM